MAADKTTFNPDQRWRVLAAYYYNVCSTFCDWQVAHMWKGFICACAFAKCAVAAAGLVLLYGCTTNPLTGRSQFSLISEQSAISSSASAYTSMIGQFSRRNQVEIGTERVERIRNIANRLIAQAVRFRPKSASWNWEVTVIRDPKVVNAFCMAGGKIGIYTGMWEKLQASDDEIAHVIGHEIGHALARHHAEKMSVAIAAGIGAIIAAGLASRGSNDPYAFQRHHDRAEVAAALAITLPNSREAETEADQIGIELAARAGFDPRAALSLWKKMAAQGGSGLAFFSTHPSPENRLERLDALVARVDPLYQLAKDGKSTGTIPTFVSRSRSERELAAESREAFAARVSSEPQVLTFLTEDMEKFKRGQVVFSCRFECTLTYSYQKSSWKQLYEKQSWRDLAVSVLKVGYLNDLSYFMLGEAARGLNLPEAAQVYYSRAIQAQKDDFSCGGSFNTCEGFDIPRLAFAGATKAQALLEAQRTAPQKPVSPAQDTLQEKARRPEAVQADVPHTAAATRASRYADLMSAVFASDKEVVTEFLARGADINERKNGSTYLIAAVLAGDIEMVKFLVERGADVNLVDNRGFGPIVYAMGSNPPNRELTEYLSGVGARNPFVSDPQGQTRFSR